MHLQKNIYSPELDVEKHLRLYLPKGYGRSNKRYPVLYMHDGQNLFHKKYATYGMIWAMDRVLEQLGLEAIVVGVDSEAGNGRLNEYSPWVIDERFGWNRYVGLGGKGALHARFIVESLIPWIDKNYRTNEIRLIGGSSLGGVMSFYMGAHYPGLFSQVLAMSTAAWIFAKEMKETLALYEPRNRQRLYLDVGTQESAEQGYDQLYLESNQVLKDGLEARGMTFKFVVEAGAEHNEMAWSRRLPDALRFLFQWEQDKVRP